MQDTTFTTHIVPFTEQDIVPTHALFFNVWMQTYPNAELGITPDHIRELIQPVLTPEDIEKQKISLSKLREDASLYSRVAKVDGEVVGVCRGHKNGDTTKLKSLYVLPEWQGKGVGTTLWKDFKKWAATDAIIVNVASYNQNAIRFYEKLGFKSTGVAFTEDRFTFRDGKNIPQIEMCLNI